MIYPQSEVDDDNEPAPENVPIPHVFPARYLNSQWGHDGICPRGSAGTSNMGASMKNTSTDPNFHPDILFLFE